MYATCSKHSLLFAQATQKPHRGFFFFNDTATTEIYTLSLHDALPIYAGLAAAQAALLGADARVAAARAARDQDRKSTRLNSSHLVISYAVFCLKKKKIKLGNQVRRQRDCSRRHFVCICTRHASHRIYG